MPRPHVPLDLPRPARSVSSAILRRYSLKECLVYFCFVVYSLVGLCFFFGLVRPWINGETFTRLGADSDRYWSMAHLLENPYSGQAATLISFNGNLLGPVLVAYLLKYQFLVVLFNYVIFFFALKVASTVRGVSTWVFLLLLMLNAETAISLITLNKEIFALFSAVLLAKYFLSPKHPTFFLALGLLTSFITRWEQAALVLLVAFLTRRNSFFVRRPKLGVAVVLASITVGYGLIARYEGAYLLAFTQYLEGANTIVKLNHLQASFGFPLVVLPKIAMNLLGELIRPNYYFGPFWEVGFVDLHSQIVLPLFSIALIILLFVAYRRGKLAIRRPLAFLIVIYLMGTAITPFIQPRYEYFVYVLLCFEIARLEDPTDEPVSAARPGDNSNLLPPTPASALQH